MPWRKLDSNEIPLEGDQFRAIGNEEWVELEGSESKKVSNFILFEFRTRRSYPIANLSPDAPMTTNEAGGKQSALPYRCDLLPAKAVLAVSAVLCKGAIKYDPNNWRKISRDEHINHAMTHILALLAGDTQDDHLDHAACRLLMALEMEITTKQTKNEN